MLGVSSLCRLINISRSSYYEWEAILDQKQLSDEESEHRAKLITEIFTKSRKAYGAVRVHERLLRAGVTDISVRSVSRIMSRLGLFSVHNRRKKRICTTDSRHTVAAKNVLQQNFFVAEPKQVWVGDVTYIRTREGWLYLAVVIDLYSRKVVGYALSDRNDAELAVAAFKMALLRRPQAKELVYHSDRGSVYASHQFKELLAKNNITPSMSRKGNCYDNAVAEAFFKTLKIELIWQQEYKLKISAIFSISEWIENFYNTERTHSTLGYCSPEEFETKFFSIL